MDLGNRLLNLGKRAKDTATSAAGAAAEGIASLPGAQTVAKAVTDAVNYVSGVELKSASDRFAAILGSAGETANKLAEALGTGASYAADAAKAAPGAVADAAATVADTATNLAQRAYELREYVSITPGMIEKLQLIRTIIQRVRDSSLSPRKTKEGLRDLKAALEAARTENPEHVSARALNALIDATLAVVNRALTFGGPTLISFMLVAVNPQLEVLDLVLGIALGVADITGIGKE